MLCWETKQFTPLVSAPALVKAFQMKLSAVKLDQPFAQQNKHFVGIDRLGDFLEEDCLEAVWIRICPAH